MTSLLEEKKKLQSGELINSNKPLVGGAKPIVENNQVTRPPILGKKKAVA